MQRRARPAFVLAAILLAASLAFVPSAIEPAAVRAATSTSARAIVTVVVGPTGSDTSRFMSWGEEIAQRAEAFGAEVRRVFYPDATWSNVVKAAEGANVFVYIGHGNGYPSPYTSRLMTDRQDGLGLDPAAGDGENSVQYYGEKYVAADFHLAPHAVVILNHLCYASGNSEPGYPDPTVDVARERADNFAAGFLAAGASGVFALGHQDGADILAGLFGPAQTLEQLFMSVGYNGTDPIRFDSVRTPGTTDFLDPEAPGAYFRSVAGYLDTLTSSVVSGAGATAQPASAGLVPTGAVTPTSAVTAPGSGPTVPGMVAAAPRLWANPHVIVAGAASLLTAQVDPSVDGQIVVFQQRPAGSTSWTDLARMTVGPEGQASLPVNPPANTEYRVESERVPGQPAGASPVVRVLVRQVVELQPSAPGQAIAMAAGSTTTFSASVRPAPGQVPGVVTFVVARLSSGHWRTVLTRSVREDGTGTATLALHLSTHGLWYIRAIARPTSTNANSTWTAAQRLDVR